MVCGLMGKWDMPPKPGGERRPGEETSYGGQRNEVPMEGRPWRRLLRRSREKVWILSQGQESDTGRLALSNMRSGCSSGNGSWGEVRG